MKKKIVNVVHLIVYLVAVVMFFTMKGSIERETNGIWGIQEGVSVIKEVMNAPLYPVLLGVCWGIGLLMCLISILGKSKKKDGKLHGILPIITLIVTDFCLLGIFKAIPNFFIFNGLMLAIIVIGFVKGANFIAE